MSAHIPKWQQRINAVDPALRKSTREDAKDAEIAELRAALAGDDPVHGSAYMYKLPGDYDWHVGFAPLPEGAFRIKALAAAPLPQQAAGDEQAAFEQWMSDEGNSPKAIERHANGYRLMQTHSWWCVWKAA